jgi:N-acyl-D-amino-acid deacylase
MYDLIVAGGKIISGAGNPWYAGDLGIAGDKIAEIGRLQGQPAGRVLNVKGCCVAPGFIDSHSHSDLFIFTDPQARPKVMQGVTTENLGLDGMSAAPIDAKDIEDWRKYLSGLAGTPDGEWTWRGFGEYLEAIDRARPSINVTSYVGLGTIRLKVMGMTDRQATGKEIEEMKDIAALAMEEGARGISAGLIYPPSKHQSLEEMAEIAATVHRYDGVFDVHMRSEGARILEAIDEVLAVARRSGISTLITHFKVRGKANWGNAEKAIEKIDKARDEGIDVTMAQYPYTAGSTMLHVVVPPWYHTAGPQTLIRVLDEEREAVKKDMAERQDWENIPAQVGWEHIFVSSVASDKNRPCEGKSMVEIAAMKGLDDPADAALDLLVEEKLAVGMILFGLDEGDVVRIMRHPAVSFITDGLLGGRPHPRVYGTFPRILGRYVRDRGVLRLEEAVRKMTSLPAEQLRLRTKGLLAEGYDADIVVFEPNTIIDRATYEDPAQFPAGIVSVIVNGRVVVENGRHSGAAPGSVIRTR